METVRDFIFLGSKITTDEDCSHEVKRHLLHGRKAMTNLDSVLKSRDVILPTKGPYGQSYGFSSSHVWMWELDHKESWRECFWTVVLEEILESPLDSKEIQPAHPKKESRIFLEGLKLKLLYFGHLMQRTYSLEKDPECWERLKAEGEVDDRGWDDWMASWTWWTWVWASSWSWWLTGKFGLLQSTGSQRVSHDWVTKLKIKKSFAEKRSQMLLMLAAYWLVKSSCSG